MSQPQPNTVPQEVAIQPAAQAEILRLHQILVTTAKAFEESRGAFNEFTKAVRHSLSIADDQAYNIKDDASAFYQTGEAVLEPTEEQVAEFYENAAGQVPA